MIGNIIILGIMIGLTYFVVKVYRSKLKDKLIYNILAVFAAISLVVVFIIPNFDFITRPVIMGKEFQILDADTKQPVPDVIILVSTYYECSAFMSLRSVITNQYLIKSNQDGTFKTKSSLRYLSFHFPFSLVPLLTRQSGGTFFDIWKKGYRSDFQPVGSSIILRKAITRKDKLIELHEAESRLDRARRGYKEKYQDMLEQYFKELKAETPANFSIPYWLLN